MKNICFMIIKSSLFGFVFLLAGSVFIKSQEIKVDSMNVKKSDTISLEEKQSKTSNIDEVVISGTILLVK